MGRYTDDSVIVRFRTRADAEAAVRRVPPLLHALGGRVSWVSDLMPGWALIHFDMPIAQVGVDAVTLIDAVEYAERNPLVTPLQQQGGLNSPNDTSWPNQSVLWGSLCFPGAWGQVTACTKMVAVIDSGVNYIHPDLDQNVWRNLAEINGTDGVDDDNNGYVDDKRGAAFLQDGDQDLVDYPVNDTANRGITHGTEMASCIMAKGNNATDGPHRELAGACWTGTILPVKVQGVLAATADTVVKGWEYAYKQGARIFNCSFLVAPADILKSFISTHPSVLFVCAAGNDPTSSLDCDDPACQVYPAKYQHDNILSVGCAFPGDSGICGNYGPISVDLFAPGQAWEYTGLFSGNPPVPNPPQTGEGSSEAAAVTSGVAALIWTQHPTWTVAQVKNRIMQTVDVPGVYQGLCVTNGRLNAARALGGVECD